MPQNKRNPSPPQLSDTEALLLEQLMARVEQGFEQQQAALAQHLSAADRLMADRIGSRVTEAVEAGFAALQQDLRAELTEQNRKVEELLGAVRDQLQALVPVESDRAPDTLRPTELSQHG